MSLSAELAALLGEDLSTLVRTLPATLRECVPLSSRGIIDHATAFRLHFDDGRLCKGTLLDTAAKAAKIAHLANELTASGIPAVYGQSGCAILTQWIDGEPLAAASCSVDVVRRCGSMHASVHNAAVGAKRIAAVDALRLHFEALVRDLDSLVLTEWLDHEQAQRAIELARITAPSTCRVTPILGDFCLDNIVIDPAGQLFFVDLETVTLDACEYDLARTWYRWPMDGDTRSVYWDGYRAHADPSAFLAHFPFWAVLALCAGAAFRCLNRPATTSVPVRRLCNLLEALDRGVAAADAMQL